MSNFQFKFIKIVIAITISKDIGYRLVFIVWLKYVLCYLVSEEEKKRRAEANAPYFEVRLKDTELLENTYLRFMIKVNGTPNPKLTL